jgi:hypothetical protein
MTKASSARMTNAIGTEVLLTEVVFTKAELDSPVRETQGSSTKLFQEIRP